MATRLNEGVAKPGQGLDIVRYGYAEAPEVALLMYDIKDLNRDNLDFTKMSLKNIAMKSTLTQTGESVEWREEDVKEGFATITTWTDATHIVVDKSDFIVGEQIFDQNTRKTALVIAVSTTSLTLASPGLPGGAANDVIVRQSFAKKYGENHYHVAGRNDLVSYTNYVQFTEEGIESDMITNNKTLLWESQEEVQKMIFSDASKRIIKGIISDFYTGKKAKTTSGGSTFYTAGGLEDFIPSGNKVNVKGADDAATKKNIRTQLMKIYQSGLSNIYGKNKVIILCTTAFMNMINDLYENKIVYNEELKAINVNIQSYNIQGYTGNFVASSFMDYHFGNTPIAYSVPVDYTFLFMLPKAALKDDGKTVRLIGKGIVYQKPQTTIEKSTVALATNYSFLFHGIGSGAYRVLTYS